MASRGVMAGEMVRVSLGVMGLAFNLEEHSVGVIILGDYLNINEGDEVRTTGQLLSVPVGDAVVGRVVDPLGNPLDGKGPIVTTERRPVDSWPPASPNGNPSATVADRYQGDRRHDAHRPRSARIDHWRPQDRQNRHRHRRHHESKHFRRKMLLRRGRSEGIDRGRRGRGLAKHGAMDYTTVILAGASDPAPLQYVAPYAGTAMAEYFMYNGQHALFVYDDLSKQAAAYRQLSLLMRRPPGREAFPGDVFYCHSRLLERSAKLSAELGGGSLTSLPIVETLEGEVSAYIPTNVISITDGQIYLQPDLFFAGHRPL